MNKIHKIGELSSKKKYFPESKLENNRISENVLVTTETLAGIKSPWKNIQGSVTADNGYKWVRKYEEGKNYIVEKILNKSNELVALYIDICSPIEKRDEEFLALDWYLDVLVDIKSRKVALDDEEEFDLAVKEGYLTAEEAKSAEGKARELFKKYSLEKLD